MNERLPIRRSRHQRNRIQEALWQNAGGAARTVRGHSGPHADVERALSRGQHRDGEAGDTGQGRAAKSLGLDLASCIY